MHCAEFRRRYSDFRDGRFSDPAMESRMLEHVEGCAECMQYDARVSRGVTLLRSLSDLEPSPTFRRELRRRLAQPGHPVEQPYTPALAGVMAALMILTAAALFWWEASDRAPRTTAAAPARRQPLPAVVANPGVPFVGFSIPAVSAARGEWRTPDATAPFADPAVLLR